MSHNELIRNVKMSNLFETYPKLIFATEIEKQNTHEYINRATILRITATYTSYTYTCMYVDICFSFRVENRARRPNKSVRFSVRTLC